MRAVIFTWEYPPRVVGNLGLYVETLATKLAEEGVNVHVVTFHEGWRPFEELDGVKVHRVANPVKTHTNILSWDLTLMTEFERVFSDIYYSVGGDVDLIDAHEWLCVAGAVALKKAFALPFVYTVHSLEEHRSHYASSPLNITIQNIEGLGLSEASIVLAKSEWMRSEIVKIHNVPERKVRVVSPNSLTWIREVIRTYEEAVQA